MYQSSSYPVLGMHRHKVFVSYHHANDQAYRDRFESLFTCFYDIMVPRSVRIGNIDSSLNADTVRQLIRNEFLSDSTVTVVLVGKDTWRRRHVDWEIAASVRDSRDFPRSGLLGIILPTYPRPKPKAYLPQTIPPRLHDNVACGYASLHDWSENPHEVQQWIHAAFRRRGTSTPDNSFPHFVNNRKGLRWQE